MSNWKKHTMVGFICTILSLIIINYFTLPDLKFIILSLIVSFVYSQLPDIDTQASKIRWITTIIIIGVGFFNLLLTDNSRIAIICMGIVLIIWVIGMIRGFKHRQVFHSWFSALILSSIIYFYFDIWLAVIAFINYISHIRMDKNENRKSR